MYRTGLMISPGTVHDLLPLPQSRFVAAPYEIGEQP